MSLDTGSAPAARQTGAVTKACILLSSVLSAYCVGGLVPALPRIEAAFAGTPGAGALVRLLVSGIGISMIIGAPLAGIAADRWGRRRVLIVSLLVYAIAGAAGGLLNNLWLVVGSRLIFGLGAAGAGTLLMSLAAEMEESDRRKWFGIATTVGTFAAMLMFPLAGLMAGLSWRLPFLAHAGALAVVVVVMVGVKDRPRATSQAASEKRTGSLLSTLPLYAMSMALVFGTMGAANQLFVPFHLRDIGITNPATMGLLMMPLVLTLGIVAYFYRHIRDYLSMGASFVFGFVLFGIGVAMFGWATSVPLFIAGQLLAGVASGILAPSYTLLAATSGTAEQAPRNMGLTRGMFYAGPLLAQVALEPLVAATRASMALFVLGALGVLTALVVSQKANLRRPPQAPA